jgi:serine/threonine protein kinase/Tfp pilus assembly protein PilF
MTPERRQQLKDLFHAAAERDPEERTAFLAKACGDNPSLLAEVRSLLPHADASDFLEKQPFAALADALAPAFEQRIGPFRIVRVIGHGGMGEVYEAVQEGPLPRTVALKLIRRDLDTGEVIARFEAERQALARMNHPNIAHVYEAGSTDEGQPYFAMEYVHGKTVTRYCDENRLSFRQRLGLLRQVCEGVKHAHQKGIIHRDLKPSNVLLALQDGEAVPKIIDFGIAKAIGDTEGRTRIGERIGTPPYMSPEQSAGPDVDTRTDIYSLGVLLGELLLGEVPAVARTGVPTIPSVQAAGFGDRAVEIAHRRQTEPLEMVRLLRGDLDWILLKALEEDRERRYSSVAELAIDLDRHLRDEPVLVARPPSVPYRVRKFLRRHRASTAAAGIALVALLAGAAAAGIGFVDARRAEGRAQQESRRAMRDAETARRISNFLTGLFHVSEPDEAKGNLVTAREILDTGARKIAFDLRGQPEVQGALTDTMGVVYQSLGLFDRAEELLRTALALRRRTSGDLGAETASTLYHLAELLRLRGRFAEAGILHRRALAIRQQRFRSNHPDIAESLNGLGLLALGESRYDDAERCFRGAFAIWEKARNPLAMTALSHLALLYREQGEYDRALPLFEQALAWQERELGPEHSDLDANLNNLADIYRNLGQYAKAEALLKRVLAVNERIMGSDHPHVATSLNNLAIVYRAEGRYAEAEALYARCLAIDESMRGPESPDVATSLNNLAVAYREDHKYAQAEPLFLRSLKIREKVLGPFHPHVAGTLNNLALLYAAEGENTRAEPLFTRSLAIREKVLPQNHPHIAITLTNLANLYRAEGRLDRAEPLLARALAIWSKIPRPALPDFANTLESYAMILRKTARDTQAEVLEHRAAEMRKGLAAANRS